MMDLFRPLSLSLGIHAALIALVLGQSGSGNGIAPPDAAAGPIVVDIVSFGHSESVAPAAGRVRSVSPVSPVSKTEKTVPKSEAMPPVQKPGVVRERIAAAEMKTPAPPPPGSPHEAERETTAGKDAPPPAPPGSSGAPDRDHTFQTGRTGPQQPMLAYGAVPPREGLPGGISGNDPGFDFIRAEATDLPEPIYPAWCRRRGQEGKVILSVRIGRDGGLGGVSVFRSSGFSMLDRAAVKALQKARFSPASAAGFSVSSTRKIAYSFQMTDAGN